MQNVEITGENYEVTGTKAQMSTLVGYIRMFLFIFMFAGEMIINSMGGMQSMPDLVKDLHGYVQENKIKFGMGLFFIGSMVQAQLMQSGAFEIYVNGELQFSKLETGRMPDFESVELILRTFGVYF